ncbi:hypothetical protein OG481_01985 [Streptomyces longwoodensis]|uniref:hypothetical protein n=1 Tax=Streptomyces longwoodensis TaxID=68231 RepID=UPI002DD8CC17|nr:hypothetical protein [Streptomyces longwoodensis]WRY87362.1 hypothetical protein OG481_01985 [Streptomyces longwoodensis]
MTDPEPYRYVDSDDFCLSARLLPDLNTGGVTDTLSITIEGSDEPQSVHVRACDAPTVAAGILHAADLPAPTDQAAVIAELLPAWEAVYEPGNVSTYLIGYANDQDAATGMAEAWMRSQAEVTGRLEWVDDEQLATGRYDRWFELVERHDDGVDTGTGIVVRRRLADETQPSGPPAADDAEVEAERQLATVQRVRHVLETEHVVGRTALEYRGLILAALMAGETQPETTASADQDCCGAEPPTTGTWGDCWCTLPPGHDGEHRCQPCTDRHGAPSWADETQPHSAQAIDPAALLAQVADQLDAERARRVKAAWSPEEATAAREWGNAAAFVRSLIPQQPTPDGVVAYSPGGRTLRCARCRPNPLGSDWQALTAEDLEHGGICTACGTDVLIREQP